MPEVSRFYGIVIKVHFGDHSPPHFHAEYGDFEIVIGIESLAASAAGAELEAVLSGVFEALGTMARDVPLTA